VRRSDDSLAEKAGQTPGMVALCGARNRLEAGDGTAAIDDEHRGTCLKAVYQRTQTVFGFRDAGYFHSWLN